MYSLKRTIYPLIIPAMLIILSSATIIKWPDLAGQFIGVKELRALVVLMPQMPYIVLALGFAMGWRFANAGLILATLALALSYYGLDFFQFSGSPREASMHPSFPAALAFLLPLNLALFSILIKRRLFTSAGFLSLLLMAGQVLVVLVFCHPSGNIALQVTGAIRSVSPPAAGRLTDFSSWLVTALSYGSGFNSHGLPAAVAAASGLALACVLLQLITSKDIRAGGFFFAVIAAFLGLVFKSSDPARIFYFMAAGLILVITTIEASFTMAYIDELTGLPGRRRLNEMLLNLGKKYTIAMIDVDRFKKFNDTYGHKTGDQVLKMIALRLGEISGG